MCKMQSYITCAFCMLYRVCFGFFRWCCLCVITPTGPCAAEESSPCDLISSSITKETEPKMLSHDKTKETQPCCSLTEECTENPLLVNQEREGKSMMILARAAQNREKLSSLRYNCAIIKLQNILWIIFSVQISTAPLGFCIITFRKTL